MTILKALKDRIRSMGGETNATNIADAIKDLPSSGGGAITYEFNLIHVDGDDPIVRTEANPVTVKEHLRNGDNVRFIAKYFDSEESEDYNTLMTTNNIAIVNGVEIVGSMRGGDLIGYVDDEDEGASWTFDIKYS